MRIVSRSAQETLSLGKTISRCLQKGHILCLRGGLGSGKTVLTKGIASGMGIAQKHVVSPTFVLIRQYAGRLPLYHFDLYRVKDFREILTLGYEEYLYDDGVSVIEWSQRLGCLMPRDCLSIEFSLTNSTTRLIEVRSSGSRHGKLLESLKEKLKR